ncbi:hypothetical protein [Streptomyces sp. NPDC054975]
MKHTNRQTITATLADLYRAIDRKHAVTVTYLKPGETEPTVRTIEILEMRTTDVEITETGEVIGGDIVIIAMCRLRGEERQFHLSGIQAYTLHRIPNALHRPAPKVYEHPTPAPANDATALVYFELERDRDDADYRPRRRLTQTDTDLAA